ncbi:exocyst complex component 3-like protein [Protopterus annectens]|uniref:exocyst complex component 3-like protein n=1 Tax=Protopterus annectens TaxID=7888 RepID=UPI001CFAFAFA|nr:exocyst complex component 3-like protein [Protopterus annectens]
MHALNALFWKAVSDCLLPAVGMSLPAEEESDTSKDDPWPELEKAEKLARGAALKWASGVFYRPDQLQRLGHYCKRETQRMASIESRLKSVVHSYLEGVGLGLGQLCSALEDVRTVCHTMKEVRQDWQNTTAGFKNLERFRELVSEHMRLTTVMHHLPQVILVPQVVEETQQLIESRQLLEAHSKLMQLECWRDNTLYQMHHSGGLDPESKEVIMCHFSRVEQLSDALAKEIWDIVGHALNFVKQDPAVFVTAVRIIEREEKTDHLIQDDQNQHQLLLPGRPKNWRQKFFKVIEEIISVQFHVTYLDIKGLGLANHLESLQNHIMNNLTIVKHLMVQCCPPEYDIFSTFVLLHQKYLSRHLQDIVSWDLSKNEVFTILNWTLNVYHSPEMLGHPDLFPEVDAMNLEPLLSKEVLQKLENKYVSEVRASMSEWMQKALEAEVNDWFRDQEPDEDHEGYYQSSLPVIIMQILSENIHLASMICSSLTEQLLVMALNELEIFLRR